VIVHLVVAVLVGGLQLLAAVPIRSHRRDLPAGDRPSPPICAQSVHNRDVTVTHGDTIVSLVSYRRVRLAACETLRDG
jgi:hypothetical protein